VRRSTLATAQALSAHRHKPRYRKGLDNANREPRTFWAHRDAARRSLSHRTLGALTLSRRGNSAAAQASPHAPETIQSQSLVCRSYQGTAQPSRSHQAATQALRHVDEVLIGRASPCRNNSTTAQALTPGTPDIPGGEAKVALTQPVRGHLQLSTPCTPTTAEKSQSINHCAGTIRPRTDSLWQSSSRRSKSASAQARAADRFHSRRSPASGRSN